jgi:hypothetical protein
MEQIEVERRLKAALVKMHVYERPHNRISFAHTKEGFEKILQDAPCDEKELKLRLKMSLGISMRYVEEYLAGFKAYGLIHRVDGVVYVDAPPKEDIKEQIRQEEIITNTNEDQNNDATGTGRNRIISTGKSTI